MKTVVTLYTLFLALSTAVFGAPAHATENPPQRVVNYSDLNLETAKGVQALYRRLSSAARLVCAPAINLGYSQRAEARACARKAVEEAVHDVNNARLTAYHLARTSPGATAKEKVASRK